MPESYLASEFMKAAVGGVSKAQVIRTFRDQYNLDHDEIRQILDLCQFKRQPKQVDYLSFYNAPITKKAKQTIYPFTQLYTQENFLTKQECVDLTKIIDQKIGRAHVWTPVTL